MSQEQIHDLPKSYCPVCRKEVPVRRIAMGYRTCVDCSQEKRIVQVEVSASSLQWI